MLKMRITNSKPTKQAERCQTLIAEKNMNNWIETSGSPFVIVESNNMPINGRVKKTTMLYVA